MGETAPLKCSSTMTIQQVSGDFQTAVKPFPFNYPIEMPIDHPLRLPQSVERRLGWRTDPNGTIYRTEAHMMERVVIGRKA